MIVQDIITKKPYLAWYVKNPEFLSDESVLEHVLNYGNWDDVKTYNKIKGLLKTSEIFKKLALKKRSNLLPEVKQYFTRYFDKYAQ